MTHSQEIRSCISHPTRLGPPIPVLTRSAPDGAVLPIWEIDDVRVQQELAEVVVYLFKDLPSAEEGNSERGATAFWVSTEVMGGSALFLVTNRHVIEDGTTTFRLTSANGTQRYIESMEDDWFFPDDNNVDLAIYNYGPSEPVFAQHIPTSGFLRRDQIQSLEMVFGDDVAMFGRHLNYDGALTNIPTSRFGHIVQFPEVPILDDRRRKEPVFLVQIPSLPGFSGSPIFLVQNLMEKNMEKGRMSFGEGNMSRNCLLLGINKGHLPAYMPTYLSDTGQRNPAITAEVNSGIAMAIPAWELDECIAQFLRKFAPKMKGA